MLFSSPEFLFSFLPVVLLTSIALARLFGQRAMLVWVIGASLFFYAWWNPVHLPVLLTSVAVNFGLGKLLYRRRSRLVLGVGIGINLLALGYFKYAGFVVTNVNVLAGTHFPPHDIALPLALSFITFQKITYLLDVYHGRTSDRSLLHYLFFASFFPQLIAGPIVHHREIVPQLRTGRFGRFSAYDLLTGGAMFLVGLYKKAVIADGIAPLADVVFGSAAPPTLLEAWGGALAYTFQIYFDFSGYIDMALGLGLVFGLRLPVNFNSPYQATSIIDFWRRWHITLSHFLRDCLYVPLGGNRRGPARRYANLMATMLLGGLWHGAGWTYVVWGGLHGLYLVVNHLWRAIRGNAAPGRAERWAGRLLTFVAVVVAWVFFRAKSFGEATALLSGMAGLNGFVPSLDLPLFDANGFAWEAVLLAVVWAIPNTQRLLGMRKPLASERVFPKLVPPAWLLPLWRHRTPLVATVLATAAAVAVLVVLAPGGKNQPFIYMIF
jgi:D-alanyl-lipoteichoic acid acyltransferase DltB (MBOAT superfamily)